MPRSKKFGKRKSHPNQYSLEREVPQIVHGKESSSKRKLKSNLSRFPINDLNDSNENDVNIIVNLNIISNLINSFVKCKFCNNTDCVTLCQEANSRRGLALNIVLKCKYCGNAASAMTSTFNSKFYDINVRAVYGFRCIGKGKKAAKLFCGILNLPPPPTKFQTYNNILSSSLKRVSMDFMLHAVNETVMFNEDDKDIAAALDGSWQKRGHTSLNGVVTATSLETGKVIDFQCLSKYCSKCVAGDGKFSHVCTSNYSGTSGGMECAGVKKICERSVSSRGVRYVKYLGDGDLRAFEDVNYCRQQC